MAEVVTLVSGVVSQDRLAELAEAYREGVDAGLPPAIEETFLLRADGGRVAILSVWRRRADLDAMIATGEEPFARRLIRTAGGNPVVDIFGIEHRAEAP